MSASRRLADTRFISRTYGSLPTSQPHQDAIQADGTSAQLLKTHEVTERKTKKQNSGMPKPDGAAKPTKLHDA
jgi:hypothetical protein